MADQSHINDKPVTLANMVLILVNGKKIAFIPATSGPREREKLMKRPNAHYIEQKIKTDTILDPS